MNVIVAGGRDEHLTEERRAALAEELWKWNDGRLVVFLGGCPTGIDEDVRRALGPLGYPYREFKAEWGVYGLRAGPVRNAEMARAAGEGGVAILFPGGRGTASMRSEAEKRGLRIVELA